MLLHRTTSKRNKMKYYKKQRKLKRANTFVSRECLVCGKATRFPKYTQRQITGGDGERQKIRGHSVLVCSVACDSQRNQKIAVDAFSLPEDVNKDARKILAVVREAASQKKDSAILSLSLTSKFNMKFCIFSKKF